MNLNEINDFEQQRTVDVAGIILDVGSVSLFQPKDQSRPAKEKRTLTIADESGLQIRLSLWGKNATTLPFDEGRVLAIKGAKVSEYGGKSLNAGDEHSQLFLDLAGDKRCDELREWYKSMSLGQLKASTSITTTRETLEGSN